MRIVGVNGILTHGARNVDLVLAEMRERGYQTVDVALPKRGPFMARFTGKKDGDIVAEHSRDGDILVAHSFGCLRAWHAHKLRNYHAVFCIAPAMSRRVKWRDPVRVHCWYSRDDSAVWAGSFLPLHPFGSAGTKGFRQGGIRHFEALGASHSDYFKGVRLTTLVQHIELAAKGEL